MSNGSELTLTLPDQAAVMPAVSSEAMVARYRTIVEIKDTVMQPGVHYGIVPGTDKPTLLKPGAETLCTAFMLTPDFQELEAPDVAALLTHAQGDVPFFMYRYRCVLNSRDGRFTVGSGIGSCNSWEKKYRYRKAERICPQCGQPAIIKGKEQYGGGWLCWTKKGGCNAKFADGDDAIESQEVGNIPNPDIAEVINTIDKMAQKRALIAATLVAVGASNFFTQDVEDLPQFNPPEIVTVQPTEVHPTPAGNGHDLKRPWSPDILKRQIAIKVSKHHAQGQITDAQKGKLAMNLNSFFQDQDEPDKYRHTLLGYLMRVESSTQLSKAEASVLIDWSESAEAKQEGLAVIRQDALEQGQSEMFPAAPSDEEPPWS